MDSTKDYIIVLGSGVSINNLSDEERLFINSCSVKIGINKYAAYYNQAGIVPTHIYYTDDYYDASRNFFMNMVKKLRGQKLSNLTFIVSNNFNQILARNTFDFLLKKIIVGFKKLAFLTFNLRLFKSLFYRLRIKYDYKEQQKLSKLEVLMLPADSKVQNIRIDSHIKRDTAFAKSIDDPMYHFKGSLSTVFNYVSIFFKGKDVLLVGVDFNSSDYFFEEELDKLTFDTKDWTYELRKKENKHYSIIETNGVKMDDELPFMLDQLRYHNINVYSANEKSYLVEKGFVKSVNIFK